MRLLRWFLLAVISSSNLFAQEQLGFHTGNYSGIGGAIYNPASFQSGALNWDLLIISAGAFAETDYVFIRDATVIDLFTNDLYRINPSSDNNPNLLPGEKGYIFTNGDRRMNNSTNAFIGFPSIAVRLNPKLSIGLFSRTRQAFSANNVDAFWSYPKLEVWNYGEKRTSDPIWLSTMLWTEVGLNLARQLKVNTDQLSVGINAKFLVGHESVFAFVPNSVDVTFNPQDYTVNTPVAYYGFTDFENGTNFTTKGTGLAFDLGVVYQIPDEESGYSWQFSASINDIGWLKFGDDAQYHVVESSQSETINRAAMATVTWIDEFTANVSKDVYGNPATSLRSNEYTIFLPTSMSFSVDHRVRKNVFAQASFTRRIVLHPHQLQRDNIWAMSVRYETKFFEVGIPAVLFDDHKPRIGTWLRLGPLTIGSDHVLTWFVPQNRLSGSDIYFSLRLNESFFKSRKPKNPDECYW